jgi:hypothetical protein
VYNECTHLVEIDMAAPNDLPEVELDAKNLYREDVFTDRRAGSIRRLTPVTSDGSDDGTRAVLFSGQTQLLTPAGVLPLGFEIEAGTLEEALQKFPDGVKLALEQAIDEAREMRREAASRIVVPEVGGGLGAGPAPGAGGGKIKFP